MARTILFICILATLTMLAPCKSHKHANDKAPHSPPNSATPAPAPSFDCMSIVFDMEDCISYLAVGSDGDSKPANTCCSGFEKVVNIHADCVCAAIKGSAGYGISLNMTRLKDLPGLCKFPAGSKVVKTCLASMAPDASPPGSNINPPSSSPKLPPPTKSPVPSPPSESPPEEPPSASPPAENGGGTAIATDAPAPVKGGAHSISTSLVLLIITLLLSSFSFASA